MTPPAVPPASPATRERALDVLLSPALEPIVDMVAWTPAPDHYEIASAEGCVRYHRRGGAFVVDRVEGTNPVANQDPTRFGSVDEEASGPHPHRRDNAYPLAYQQFSQLFDHPSAPDLCVIHAAAHNWEQHGGHLGEHGSLGVVQARAPFVAAGASVQQLGLVDGWCRLVDVAPTILALLGCGSRDGKGHLLNGQDGEVLTGVIDDRAEPAAHVVGLLFDGTNANVLYDLAARGGAPNVARLMTAGVAFRSGAVASLPTVTLANHTATLTGRHPGHHGILHNAWVDRRSGHQVVANSPATWPTAMTLLDGDVDTIHTAVKRLRAGSTTASINEPCDTGADYSTFDLIRRGEAVARPPAPHELPDATERFVRPSKDYRWSSRVDHTAVDQFCGIWNESVRVGSSAPTFTWVNFTLTDAAFHEGGPYSDMAAAAVADTDARLGRILDAVEASGRWDRTAFVLVADHGMEETDRTVTGDWDEALRASGVAVRDEGYGFLYLVE